MSVRNEIAERVERLSPAMQEEVLRFVSTLNGNTLKGEPGPDLLRFSGFFDPDSLDEMSAAIEEGCERVDPDQW